MKITFWNKIKILFEVYKCLPQIPMKYRIYILIKPLESTRYTEFAYLFGFIKNCSDCNFKKILDISSPFIMSYILSKYSYVIKTDINEKEKIFIKENKRLSFQIQDARMLTYKNNHFDMVYSISVIEHIFNNYLTAIREMIRVVKNGGYIYLTFPVSNSYTEEWINSDIYSNQGKSDSKTFFQYRFDERKFNEIINKLSNVKIISYSIYWERKNELYNRYIEKIRKKIPISHLNFLKDSLLQFYYGFTLLKSDPESFIKAKCFGNVSIILKKISK